MRCVLWFLLASTFVAPLALADEPVAEVPLKWQPLLDEARLDVQRGDLRAAEDAYRKLIDAVPDNAILLGDLGVVLFRQRRLHDAEVEFRKELALSPKDGFAHTVIGLLLYNQGKSEAAEQELTLAVSLSPTDPTPHDYIGLAELQAGRTPNAIKEFEAAIELDEKYADPHYNLAVAFATMRPARRDEACEHYDEALRLGAERDPALERLLNHTPPPELARTEAKHFKRKSRAGDGSNQ